MRAKESKVLPEGDNRAHSRMAAGKQEGQISAGKAFLCPVDYQSRSKFMDFPAFAKSLHCGVCVVRNLSGPLVSSEGLSGLLES